MNKIVVARELVKVAELLTAGGWGRFSEDLSDALEALPLIHKGKSDREIVDIVHRDRGLMQLIRAERMTDGDLLDLLRESRMLYRV